MPGEPLQILLANTFLILVSYAGPFIKWTIELLVLSLARNRTTAGPGCCFRPWSHMIQQIQWCLKCQWAAPVNELQLRPLGFWSKILPSSADNYSHFEKQLFTCYWTSTEAKCLNMGHLTTMQTELPTMKWMLSDPPGLKVRHAQ